MGAVGQWERWITSAYRHLVGESLCDPGQLYTLPAVVLCHDTRADPVFVYANAAAQALWERPWEQFIGLPSRLTAPVEARAERAAALAAEGLVTGYSGVRVSATGRLFRIHDATVWTVSDAAGTVRGQAATFARVTRLD